MDNDRLQPLKIEAYQVAAGVLHIQVIQGGTLHGPNWPIDAVNVDYQKDRLVISVNERLPAPGSKASGRVVSGHTAAIRRTLEVELAEALRGRSVVDRATGDPVPESPASFRRPPRGSQRSQRHEDL